MRRWAARTGSIQLGDAFPAGVGAVPSPVSVAISGTKGIGFLGGSPGCGACGWQIPQFGQASESGAVSQSATGTLRQHDGSCRSQAYQQPSAMLTGATISHSASTDMSHR